VRRWCRTGPSPFPGFPPVAALEHAHTYGQAMAPTKPDRRERLAVTSTVEPSSWWLFVAIFLVTLSCFGVLVVHLLLDATHASAWGLLWLAVPGAFFCGYVGALFIASGTTVRHKLAAIPAALLGYSPRERSKRPPISRVRESA
jgi:hypothetical protein